MPAVPVLAAIGGGSALAGGLTAAATGAGIYQAVSGADASRRAAHAAQDQANAMINAGRESQQQARDAQLLAYFNSDPAFQAEYNRNRADTGDQRSPTQWLSDGLASNPADAAKFQAFTASNPSGVIPSTAMGPGGLVDVNILQQQAQGVARQNAANSAALEQQYNPGAAELRSGSLAALNNRVAQAPQAPVGTLPTIAAVGAAPAPSAASQAVLAQVAAQAGQPLTGAGYDSQLTRDAIAKARADLALGGLLPQDVRNLVARNAFAKAGTIGSIGLGRDIVARDLGLTSLDLERARLAAALQAGGAEAALNQGNAAMGLTAQQYARNNLLQSQGVLAADDAAARDAWYRQQALQQQADQLASQNYFNQNNLLQNIQNGDFARTLSAAQFGQNIAQPVSGLDPGSVASVAVGNTNLANNAQQNANAASAAAAQQKTAFGSQLLGAGLGFAQNFIKPVATNFTSYATPGYFNVTPGFGGT